MPIGRYFAFAGSVLLALLFAIDWYSPRSVAEAAGTDVDRTTIRIHTSHKWPSAVVFDTNQPIIVPPAPEVVAETPAAKSPREALAMVQQLEPVARPATPTASPKRTARRTKIARTQAARIASYETSGFSNPFPAGW